MSSFWLLCENGTCHCDWRVTLVDCVERNDMLAMCVVEAFE
ncbi:hypothetical protein RO3G_02930 [Rhizopus delemar RA 99-880]|uniref:Uncharacterized protein n=1 Tax=Rhizopus delemar (strain RA 99-880 / ATCC MYA-4621 / FGSC 9543 / NRRL 43880) TaxID=246409 RepID=I1BPU6_RHIO9|nr:hypothetical protein RO3G_02930 [Rhizopus delemar RA 99-880]|eukprot:EIE78226.1 hypothetical protein RO3G_02930 [Rhizopus delemar RA 99-880]